MQYSGPKFGGDGVCCAVGVLLSTLQYCVRPNDSITSTGDNEQKFRGVGIHVVGSS